MKNIYISFLILLPLIGIGQNQLYIGSGSTITANTAITIADADLTNNGTYNGALKMAGTSIDVADTFITNNNTINVTVLDIEGNNTVNIENGDITISNTINLNSDNAILILGSANIILESTAQINNESNSRRIFGANGTFIKITKNHTTGSLEAFGNIGVQIDIADSSLGNTEVYRRYNNVIINGSESIDRYYEIRPTNNANAEVRFYFIDSDLNGLEQSSLNLYQSTDGSSDWVEFQSIVNDENYPYIISSGTINPAFFWALAESGPTLNSNDFELSNINIYPNPTNSFINVNIPHSVTLENLILTDINGKVIDITKKERLSNLNKLSEGIYFLKINTDKGTSVQKLIIKN